jgi:hypothetical protein
MCRVPPVAPSICVAVLALGFSTLGFAQLAFSQQEFRWKFREGDSWDVVMTQELVNELNGKRVETDQLLRLRWHIKEVYENGSAAVEQSVRHLRLRSGGQVLIDSGDSEPQETDAPITARLRSMLQVKFTAVTTSRGEIIDVQFDPEILERLRNQLGLDEETVRNTFTQESLQFPSRALDVGATWTSTSQTMIQGIGAVKTSTTYQYVGEEEIDGLSFDKFKITPAFQLDDPSRALVKQDGSSTLWFDRERGRMFRAISEQEFEIKRNDESADPGQKSMQQKNVVKTVVQYSDANE